MSALDDPMISPSLDHLPFMLGGADVSVTVEQQISLSGIRRHRRASALADQVLRDMFRPMATIRTGPAYTMAEGRGWMAMVGLSLPIWRGKLHAGVAEAQAMRAMSEAELRAMTRMIEGDAADRVRACSHAAAYRARMKFRHVSFSVAGGRFGRTWQ